MKTDLEETIEKIAEVSAKRNKETVNEYIGKTNDTLEGFSQVKT